MASAKTILGALGATVVAVGAAVTISASPPKPKAKVNVPKDAKHLWARQADGGTLLRDPLLTLDDGGCQVWATRCADKKCRAGGCE